MKKKFGMVIGNPPYNDDTSGDNKTFAPPVYNILMDAAHKVADKTVLITPARFLFDAGATPKDFNRRMLNDPHFKVLDYAPDAGKYFKGVDIEGGVAVTLYDNDKNFGAIGTFTPWQELNAIHQKVVVDNPDFKPLSEIMFSAEIYHFTNKMHEDFPDAASRLSKGHAYDFKTNVFEKLPDILLVDKPDDGRAYIKILGVTKLQRVYRWIRRDYVNAPAPLEKFKVFISNSFGRSNLGDEPGQLISPPLIGEPLVGNTQTFMTVGAFDTRAEVEACLAYVKSKFARVMLGILKAIQNNPPSTWAKVPLQDFKSTSDIDWRSDVDAQLYRKYNLTATEIDFIEAHVKAMA